MIDCLYRPRKYLTPDTMFYHYKNQIRPKYQRIAAKSLLSCLDRIQKFMRLCSQLIISNDSIYFSHSKHRKTILTRSLFPLQNFSQFRYLHIKPPHAASTGSNHPHFFRSSYVRRSSTLTVSSQVLLLF